MSPEWTVSEWLLGLDSVPLAVSEANRGATGGQPEDHERRRSRSEWLAALDDFRNYLIRDAWLAERSFLVPGQHLHLTTERLTAKVSAGAWARPRR